ncbi:unnamed protein product [Ectocarpus sp. 12 AP-2014]
MALSWTSPASLLAVLLLAGAACPATAFFGPGPQSASAVGIHQQQHARSPTTIARAQPPPTLASCRKRRHPRQRHQQQRRTAAGRALAASAPTSAPSAGTATAAASGAFAEELGVLDEEQAAMMAEECILVDRNDRPTGSASKVETHLTSKGLLLHRAFSVFLFDKKGRVLMQRRAESKHTFAGYWTNTCCSHPLWNDIEMGTDMTTPRGEKSASEGDAAIAGATRAAVRKLGQELGIPAAQLPLEEFSFLTKVHYIANSGSTWGEHEIDYVYLIQADVDLDPNPNEASGGDFAHKKGQQSCLVSDAEFLDKDGLRSLLARAERGEVEFTPWSAYIIDKFVFGWWDHVGDKEKLASLRDSVIHRVGSCADEEEE